jgi:Protein of unknown function (DUF3108)
MVKAKPSICPLSVCVSVMKQVLSRHNSLVAAIALVASAVSLPAAAGPVEGRYQVTVAGLSIGHAQFQGTVSAQSYRTTLNAQLTGLAGALTAGRAAVTVSGTFSGQRTISNGYALTATNSKINRTIQIGMAGGNLTQVAIDPPFEPQADRVPVLEHHRRSVTDPLSALIMPVAGTGEDIMSPDACNRVIPVFDGVQRFDIQLSHADTRPINEPRKGYVGQALVCTAKYTPIAGHRPIPATTYMANNRDMTVWLVPVAGSRALVPWRIQVKSQVGMVVIEAQSMSGLQMDATASIKR